MKKSITFIVTKDCQLACKYCYLVGKNNKERMTWDVAKSAVDYILNHESDFQDEGVIWDFIGGEPFLEIDLIDRICDYIKSEMYIMNHSPSHINKKKDRISNLSFWRLYKIWIKLNCQKLLLLKDQIVVEKLHSLDYYKKLLKILFMYIFQEKIIK